MAEGVDIALHYGPYGRPGFISEELIGQTAVVVGAPSYVARLPPLMRPQDISQAVLLQHMKRTDGWAFWAADLGVDLAGNGSGLQFEHYYMIIQAAVAGLGLALVPRVIVEEELGAGTLVSLFGRSFASGSGYHVVFPEGARNDAKVQHFHDWLHLEAGTGQGEGGRGGGIEGGVLW